MFNRHLLPPGCIIYSKSPKTLNLLHTHWQTCRADTHFTWKHTRLCRCAYIFSHGGTCVNTQTRFRERTHTCFYFTTLVRTLTDMLAPHPAIMDNYKGWFWFITTWMFFFGRFSRYDNLGWRTMWGGPTVLDGEGNGYLCLSHVGVNQHILILRYGSFHIIQ